MISRPRTGVVTGLLGLTLAGHALAQTPSPQIPPGAGYRSQETPWKSAPSPQTHGSSGSPRSRSGSTGSQPPTPGSAASAQSGTNGAGDGANPPTTGAGGAAASAGGAGGAGGTATAPGATGSAANGAAGGAGAGDGTVPSLAPNLGGAAGGAASYFGMLGDMAPPGRLFVLRVPTPPPIPNPGHPPVPPPVPHVGNARAVAVFPSIRGFKIAENQSPQPQDRIYYSFNYYDNLNQQVNQRLNSDINHLKAYRNILGLEKTFLDGRASFGLRLPIDNLSTSSPFPGLGGTTTSAGDLAAILKYALILDRDAGRVLSVGLLTSMPTGPHSFAGTHGIRSPHNAALQPFVGFIQSYGDFYVQGFASIDVPMNPNDVTYMYNDIGMGYYVYRSNDLQQLITAIAPTLELHVNTPLNHRNPYNLKDLAGSYDQVDLTFGTNFQIRKRGLLALAVVEPLTGPRPFRLEAIVQFNYRF